MKGLRKMGEEVVRPCNLPLGTTYSEPQWISNKPVPAVGDIVNVRVNSIGKCKVLKYFVEHNFLGLFVQPLNPPLWYVKQNGADEPCHVFPAETEELRLNGEQLLSEKTLDISTEI